MAALAVSHTRRVLIGCAGWSIGSADRDRFGEGDSMLARYATVFDAVEINSSFYRPHQHKTYQRWADSVPARFRFSVKIPKAISHEARLRKTGPMLDKFLQEASGLGEKLSVLLLQLPPSLSFDARVVAAFLRVLRARWSGDVVCEPRHRSWFDEEAKTMLDRYGIANVGADPAPHPLAGDPSGPVRYWRWHGSPRMYYSEYSAADLMRLRAAIDSAPADTRAWVIFDNTAAGHAVGNALALRELLGQR